MSEKKLTIAVKADTREGQKLQRFLSDLQREGSKTAKALQGISLSMVGKDAQRGGIAKAVLENKKLFKELGDAGKDLKKMFERDVGRGAEDAAKRLNDLNSKLKNLTDSYKRNREEVERLKKVGDYRGARAMVKAANADRDALYDATDELISARKMSGVFGGGGGFGSKMFGGAMDIAGAFGLPPWMFGAAGIGGILYGLARYGGMAHASFQRGAVSQYTMPVGYAAAEGQVRGALDVSRVWGDPRTTFWDSRLKGTGQMSQIEQAAANAKKEKEFQDSRWGMARGMHFWDLYMSIWDNSDQSNRVKNRVQAGQAAGAKTRQELTEGLITAAPELETARGWFDSDYRSWLSRRRKWGLGYDKRSMTTGIAAKYGVDEGDVISGTDAAVNQIGRQGVGLASTIAVAVRSGMAAGVAGAIAGGGAATANGANTLSVLFGRGLDPILRGQLGGNINQFLGADRMLGSPDLLANMLASGTAGLGSAMQSRVLQQNMMGMGSLNALTNGGDAWQKSVNLANAISVMGPGGSIYAQNKLANMDFSTLAQVAGGGAVPYALQGMGIGRGEAGGMMNKTVATILRRFADNPNDTTPAAQIARQIMGQYGGDIGAWGKSFGKDDKAYQANAGMLSGLLTMVDPAHFQSESQAEGAINVLSDRPGTHGKGRGVKAPEDPDETEMRRLMRDQTNAIKENTKSSSELSRAIRENAYRQGMERPPPPNDVRVKPKRTY